MACNPGDMPGFQERVRRVLGPIRGQGKCPSETSIERYEKRACNHQPCFGDEVCVAKQDLIIAVDASGSLRESGFEILRDFAANLTGKYKSRFFGVETVRIGAILFGNGARLDDGTVTPATKVVPLTGDFELVREKIEATTWQKGFTNMAQAFVLADTMFQQGGRPEAQAAILMLSDGKYSLAFETEQAAKKLKGKNTMIYMAPVADFEGDWQHKLKDWASQPWETNYEHIPGLQAMKHNMGTFTQALVAKFCPDAVSPSGMALKDQERGFMLVHEGGFPSGDCGDWMDLGFVSTPEECFQRTQTTDEVLAFSVTGPEPYYNGKMHCYGEKMKVTSDTWNKYVSNREDVPCEGGSWLDNPMYDVYVTEPLDLGGRRSGNMQR